MKVKAYKSSLNDVQVIKKGEGEIHRKPIEIRELGLTVDGVSLVLGTFFVETGLGLNSQQEFVHNNKEHHDLLVSFTADCESLFTQAEAEAEGGRIEEVHEEAGTFTSVIYKEHLFYVDPEALSIGSPKAKDLIGFYMDKQANPIRIQRKSQFGRVIAKIFKDKYGH